jgi:hypothetical protein
MLSGLNTSQHSCSFYMSWFTRCYETGENGWIVRRTPDGLPVMDQDAFFWNALEWICRELNAQIALERAKLMQK